MDGSWLTWICSVYCVLLILHPSAESSQNASCIRVDNTIHLNFSEPLACSIPSHTDSILLQVANISLTTMFATFQMHTRHRILTGSLTKTPSSDKTMKNPSVGLDWVPVYFDTTMSIYVSSNLDKDVTALFMALPYEQEIYNKTHSSLAPVPGGCNQIYNLEDDPNLHISYDAGYQITTVEFAAANVGYQRGAWEPVCDKSTSARYKLVYEFYVRFLPYTDPNVEDLFTEINRMTTIENIEKYGKKIKSFKNKDKPVITLMTYEGHGAIYNIIVRDPSSFNRKSAYVPVVSYACNMTQHGGNDTDFNCQLSVPVYKGTILIYTFAALAGFVICYFGHRLFFVEIFFFGCLPMAFGFHMVFAANTSLSKLAISALTTLFGAIGGCSVVGMWWRFGKEMPLMLLVSLDLGLLFSLTLFFTPFGRLDVWHTTSTYGLTIMCGVLLPAVALIMFPKWLFILSSAFWGSYLIIAAFSYFLGGILQYIIVNVVRRASIPGYGDAYLLTPFRVIDYTLVALWPLFIVTGVLLQRKLIEGKPIFPPCPYKVWKEQRNQNGELRVPSPKPDHEPTENSPLIVN